MTRCHIPCCDLKDTKEWGLTHEIEYKELVIMEKD